MEIEVGDYARTEDGEIGKVTAIINELVFINTNQYWSHIVKHSKILTEVVEVGDYVNEKEVYIQDGKLAVELAEHIPPYELLENIDIETILTKEQYKQNCYKVDTN